MVFRNRSSYIAALLCVGILAWSEALSAPASRRIHLTDGRHLDVAAFAMESGQAVLTLPEGDTIGFPAARVSLVEELPPAKLHLSASRMEEQPVSLSTPPAAARSDSAPGQPQPAAAETVTEQNIESLIREAADKYDLESDLLAAVIAVESGYRLDAVSPKGALGLMQLMPATAKELAVSDPFDAGQNIDAGARYLRQLLDANGGQYWKALAAYNAGAGRVARYNGVPPYRETISYVKRVLKRYASPQTPPQGQARRTGLSGARSGR